MTTKAPFAQTFKFISRLAEHYSFGMVAKTSGVTLQTAEAWGREPESNENPFGTGRKNPMDGICRLMALAHQRDPALCREIAEMFSLYADFLDGRASKASKRSVNDLIGASVKEHADVVIALLNQDEPNYEKAHTEIVQAKCALDRLDAWVAEETRMKLVG